MLWQLVLFPSSTVQRNHRHHKEAKRIPRMHLESNVCIPGVYRDGVLMENQTIDLKYTAYIAD